MEGTSGGIEEPLKKADTVRFPGLADSKYEYAKFNQEEKDEKLCKEIVEDLGSHDELVLAGEAGIGKTRLAKLVGEHATKTGSCFLTLCLHLNHKFEDEWSLYENIASHLSVYLDFKETEVDDRDKDKEDKKKLKADDLEKLIIEEIIRQKMEAFEKDKKKKKKEEADKANKDAKNVKKKLAEEDKNSYSYSDVKMPYSSYSEVKMPYLLLILDDEGNKTTQHMVMKDLKLEEFVKVKLFKDPRFKELLLKELNHCDQRFKDLLDKDPRVKDLILKDMILKDLPDPPLKILLTRRKGYDEQDDSESDRIAESAREIEEENDEQDDSESDSKTQSAGEIKEERDEQAGLKSDNKSEPAEKIESGDKDKEAQVSDKAHDDSEALRNSINEDNMRDLFLSLTPSKDWETYKEFIPNIGKKSKNSPAAIFVLAKSLQWITQSKEPSSPSDQNKEKELKDKIVEKTREVYSADRSESATNPILYLAYELLETNQINRPSMDAILDCFWHSLDFFEHCGCVDYRDLITQWILEGYFDPVWSVKKAYQAGYSVLIELINRGMLMIQEDNMVVPEMAMRNVIDPRRRGHLGRSRLGFSKIYGGSKNKGLGKITQLDDMIKTVQAKKGDKITTIMVSGDRLRRVSPIEYFSKSGELRELEVLVLFEPTLDPFVPSFKDLVSIRVLVIRDCVLLDSIEDLKTLTKLNALEVSGASSLKNISDNFFETTLKLQSLHLSGLQITSSPSSISGLAELRCLIIKDCPLLEDLPKIQKLEKLEVVDISGARGLQTCFDNKKGADKDKSKNKNFYHLTKLQLLDFSESQVERIPMFQDAAVADKLHSLTRLLLRNCSKLRRLPSLKPLSGLQILDLSGTTSLMEMLEVCFEDKEELKTLNLSGTNLSELATTIEELSGLNELLLRNCTNLKVVPNIEKLTNLEVIDVSGSVNLESIEGSFEKLSYLREVNLVGTKVKTPELPKGSKICGLKRITLANGKKIKGMNWSDVSKEISKETGESQSDEPPASACTDKGGVSKEISKETGEIQSVEPPASACTEKGDVNKDRLLQVPLGRDLYKQVFGSTSPQEAMEMNETNELDDDALANAEFVSFVDCSSTRLTSVFNKTKSVKRCWLKMCIDIKDLFSGVTEEHLGALEILWIKNLPSLETISGVASLKNLKDLSIDCCPKIKTIFPEMPSSLEVLNFKHCEKLEKVFTGADSSTFPKPTLTNCPNFKCNPEELDYVMVEHGYASPQD